MPLHTQAGDTTAVATPCPSLTSTPIPRKPPTVATEPHRSPLDRRSPDTGLGSDVHPCPFGQHPLMSFTHGGLCLLAICEESARWAFGIGRQKGVRDVLKTKAKRAESLSEGRMRIGRMCRVLFIQTFEERGLLANTTHGVCKERTRIREHSPFAHRGQVCLLKGLPVWDIRVNLG